MNVTMTNRHKIKQPSGGVVKRALCDATDTIEYHINSFGQLLI